MSEIKKISLQDIFSAAWQHFIVEDNRPASDETRCEYLMSDGRKCAIGLVLPDGHPSQSNEGLFGDLVSQYPELWADDVFDMSIPDPSELDNIQACLHDDLQTNGYWSVPKDKRKQLYIEIAEKYNLTVPDGT
jgi:hypothetical protein